MSRFYYSKTEAHPITTLESSVVKQQHLFLHHGEWQEDAAQVAKWRQWNLERPVALMMCSVSEWSRKEFCGNQWGTDFYVFDNYQHISCYRTTLPELPIHRDINHQVIAIPMWRRKKCLPIGFYCASLPVARKILKFWDLVFSLPTTDEGVLVSCCFWWWDDGQPVIDERFVLRERIIN